MVCVMLVETGLNVLRRRCNHFWSTMPCNWPSDVIILEAAEMAAVAFGKTACLAFLENEVVVEENAIPSVSQHHAPVNSMVGTLHLLLCQVQVKI